MKKLFTLLFVTTLVGFMLLACDRETRVEADSEQDVDEGYQPLPAPNNEDIQGELLRVNVAGGSFVIRAENGMEQTFKVNDRTQMTGEGVPTSNTNQLRSLAAKKGADVSVRWIAQGSDKIAVSIDWIDS